jgi:hypothetical protein
MQMATSPATGWGFFASKLSHTVARSWSREHVAYAARTLPRQSFGVPRRTDLEKTRNLLFGQQCRHSMGPRWAVRQHPPVERFPSAAIHQRNADYVISSSPAQVPHQTRFNDSHDSHDLVCSSSNSATYINTPIPCRSPHHSHVNWRLLGQNSHQTVRSALCCASFSSSLTLQPAITSRFQQITAGESNRPNCYTSVNHQNSFQKVRGPHGRHATTRFAGRAMHWRPFDDSYGRNRLTVMIKKFEYWSGMDQSSPELVVYAIIALNCVVFLLWQNQR